MSPSDLVVQLTELDGNRVLRQSADDGVEVRVPFLQSAWLHSSRQKCCCNLTIIERGPHGYEKIFFDVHRHLNPACQDSCRYV